jgi:choline-sulfatase
MGDSFINTPNIDRLAETGTIFQNAFTAHTSNKPALHCILNGQYASTHGILNEDSSAGPAGFSIITHLSALHYKTSVIGEDADKYKTECGYAYNTGNNASEKMCTNLTEKAVAYIKNNTEKPFFLSIAFPAPETPFTSPSPFNELYHTMPMFKSGNHDENLSNIINKNKAAHTNVLRNYYGQVTYIDSLIEHITNVLTSTHLVKQTIIVFTGRRGYCTIAQNEGMFSEFLDHNIRIPLIISAPGIISKKKSQYALMSSIDILPTVLACAGLNIPVSIQGKEILTSIEKDEQNFRNEVFSESRGYADKNKPNKAYMLRNNRWKYISSSEGNEILYDLIHDKHETNNLAERYRFNSEKNQMKRLMKETKFKIPGIEQT